MSSIPEDVYLEIFLKVPLKSLLACKCVCRSWFSIISNSNFIKMQLNHTVQRNNPNLLLRGDDSTSITGYCRRNVFYSICCDELLSVDKFHEGAVELDYPFKFFGYSVQLMSCCDGLVCLWFDKQQRFCLWNPATRENRILPKSNVHHVRMVAFGYDYKSGDYKLLAAGLGTRSLFEVYSVGLNSWKSIEEVPYGFHGCNKGVLVNGDFHWLAVSPEDYSDVLVSLDISNEIFKEMELPIETLEDDELYFLEVGVLEGCLCLLEDFDDDHAKIWVMQNYGVRESWTVRYAFQNHGIINHNARLLWSFKSGEILFGGVGTAGLLVYDPKSGETREPNISGSYFHQQELYFESLVSLKSSTPKKKWRNVRVRVQKIKKQLKKRA